jgi:putative NIF3 family GTP cyclohydrolase 1 type 2
MFWDMKMLKRVTSVLESFAPLTLAETSWDNVGLFVRFMKGRSIDRIHCGSSCCKQGRLDH